MTKRASEVPWVHLLYPLQALDIHLELGQAQAHVRAILEVWETGSLYGALEPFRIYLTCVEVLRAAQDRRAEELLAKAHLLLHRQAAQIPDLALRRTFLESEQATAIHEEELE